MARSARVKRIDTYACRDAQREQLKFFLDPELPSPPCVVVHGPEGTCKTSIVNETLQESDTPYVVIKCRECITGRHLIEQILFSCLNAVVSKDDSGVDRSLYTRCESLSALAVGLQALLKDYTKFVLVLDNIDQQREASSSLVAGLIRIAESILQLTLILIVRQPDQRHTHHTGIPHIPFPAYTRAEIIEILSLQPLPLQLGEGDNDKSTNTDYGWLWTAFVTVIYDSIGRATCNNVEQFQDVCSKLWVPFTDGLSEEVLRKKDFARIMVSKRNIFQNENVALESVNSVNTSTSQSSGSSLQNTRPDIVSTAPSAQLSYTASHLILAAYLASYSPPRLDMQLFSKSSEKRKRRRKNNTTPSSTPHALGTPSSASKSRRFSRRFLQPSPFPLERLLAIYQTILPEPVTGAQQHRAATADTALPILATLCSLRLLVRAGLGSSRDEVLLDGGTKYKVNVSWDFAVEVGNHVGFDLREWMTE